MSRFAIISVLVALVATCHSAPVFDYQALSNPVIVSFEEAIKESIATNQVPALESTTKNPFSDKLERREYNKYAKQYQAADNLFEKVSNLAMLQKFRWTIVDDVLDKTKEKLQATSTEEAEKKILEACKDVEILADLILDEDHANLSRRKEFLNGDKEQLRAVGLNGFCNFLRFRD